MKKIVSGILILALGFALAQPAPIRIIGADTSKANIPIDEILSGGPPPQGIPALGFEGDWQGAARASRNPSFVSQEEAAAWLGDEEPVIAFSLNGEARAYPLQILVWHEIANDVVGGVPVAVTFCPLCNSALAFDRRVPLNEETQKLATELNSAIKTIDLDKDYLAAYSAQEGEQTTAALVGGMEVSFGVSGMLYNSNLIMFDTKTSTLWTQLLGQGNVGTLTGTNLLRYPAQIVSFAEFRAAFPGAEVLSRDTGFNRRYGQNPYVGYDRADSPAFLFTGLTDGRLPPKARVVSLEQDDDVVAYPFEILEQVQVVNDMLSDMPIAIFWQEGTSSSLDSSSIADSKDVGAVGVFNRMVANQELSFSWNGESFVDNETGSTWNLLGQATSGELAGEQLTPIVHDNTLWFAWAAFKPETRIYTGSN